MAESADSINAVDDYGNTALHRAAEHGSVTRIHQLLRDGANLEVRDEEGSTPLIVAVRNEEQEAVDRLLESGAALDARDSIGNTSLHYAAGAGNPDLTARLLEAHANPHARNDEGATPMHAVTSRSTHIEPGEDSIETVELLQHAGADLNAQDRAGNTALHFLADGRIEGARRLTEALLERGARLDLPDVEGHTPVDIASADRSGVKGVSARVVREVFEKHQEQQHSREADSNPASALEEHQAHEIGARFDNNQDSIQKTGLSVQDLDYADRMGEESPLHVSAAAGDLKKVDSLLKHGANPNELDANHRTPLHEAVDAGSLETVDRLLQAGANPNRQDAYLGHSALHRAVQAQSQPIAERLLKSGANPNLPDVEGNTPFHCRSQALRQQGQATRGRQHPDRAMEPIATLPIAAPEAPRFTWPFPATTSKPSGA